MSDDVFSRLSLSREDLSQYFASDISQLSTLKTLQDVCGLGVASTCFNNAAWLSGNATPKLTQTSVKQSTCSEINGGNVDHPFYNRRRRATSSEEGLTRTRDKYRVVYTDKQRKGLEKAYEENKFITMETRNKLSKELDLSDRQIKIWFQNRRAKERRDLKRSSDAESSTSDSDHSNSSDFIDSASMTPSCRFGGNKNEYTKNTLPIAHYHNETGTNTTTDPFFGYQTVPSFIDSQPMFCSYSSSHGDLHYVDHTPLDIYSSFPTGRL
ncbi:homeotic protein caudal-like [Dreissena polymorpha]|uniref:homeotic protein caudal-like n=1 Tax=Dreissena polymorpha TaxID=45954 RepID=UPI002264C05C|nr:homeotic protein caudal-like [Dreissena polymorpha]XP_052281102.1 homeotic protein caudal-like [Dreissena polymorpha]